MRSLKDINKDILTTEDTLDKLLAEKNHFSYNCPHPKVFVTTTTRDIYDECGSPVYEHSWVTHTCSLCEGNWVKQYHRKNGIPTIQGCIS